MLRSTAPTLTLAVAAVASTLAAKCSAAGGMDAGPGSCSPNPCLPGATTSTTGATTTTTTLAQTQCCVEASVFFVNSCVTFAVQNLTMANCPAGAITNGGTLNVTNSMFSGNTSSSTGFGGAIDNHGPLNVTNSTFSGNSASTQGGAIVSIGTAMVVNSILANSSSGGNCSDSVTFAGTTFTGTITDGGHNIDDGTTCGFTGASFSNTNPLLDPTGLASNGGPTQTIALEAGSPAINAGD